MIVCRIALLANLIIIVACRGPRHPTAGHHHYYPQPSIDKKVLNDDALLHDQRRHIEEDYGHRAYKHSNPKTVDEEMEFHYFKEHDLDNNTKLDGLEIYHALRHIADEKWMQNDDNLIRLIDQVLYEDDINNDGYLSYPEYVIGRQKEKKQKH